MRRASLLLLCIALSSCATTTAVRYENGNPNLKPTTLALEYQDFKMAAQSLVNDMIKSGALDRPGGGRYVVAISTIINDTTQDIDTDQLIKDIRVALLKSGKAVITTYVKAGGPEDPMTGAIRKLRGNDEFNPKTLPGKHQLIAPDLSLSGKIVQRVLFTNEGKKVEYYFILTLTDLKTGLAIWEGEKEITKVAGPNHYTW
ncbi:penicillin-binding protein activator LpoB [Thermovibrio ammonificans]|uniref:Penicillin-binding protein activator LpoB n=1 Tax=Thermovibrio ammonificans (strain DSM 15698 / JCM 12110 / HB-1) TaxID=648996 RepID=E8T2N9_THEA1|nr:penicillin-binding protein activator LpoB [Thermovibrio ammonificans]ADU97134.1 membrane lipoprotein lipid attachment site [Thermovibrio ammonificans HB-1]